MRAGMISFASGLPSPASFPQQQLPAFLNHMLQDGASEGEPELGTQTCTEMQAIGFNCKLEQALVLSVFPQKTLATRIKTGGSMKWQV